MSRSCVLRSDPTNDDMVAKEIFSSWPEAAFVAGVKIGSGSLSDSFRPVGRSMPQTFPEDLYSFQADPEIYPRTTHSTGNISDRFTCKNRRVLYPARFFCQPAERGKFLHYQ